MAWDWDWPREEPKAPEGPEDYPNPPAGFLLHGEFVVDGIEYIRLAHLCGELATIE